MPKESIEHNGRIVEWECGFCGAFNGTWLVCWQCKIKAKDLIIEDQGMNEYVTLVRKEGV